MPDATDATTYREVPFTSAGTPCLGWHFTGAGEAYAGPAGRPVVVMGHGLAGTMDSGLVPTAEGLAAAGLDVLTFDYRGFGHSGGTPRQRVSVTGQLEDWRAAVAAAQALPGVDPRRVVLWGESLAGGHVLTIAADRDDVAAVIAVVPLVDGLAAGRHAMASHSLAAMARSTGTGVRSRLSAARGGRPVMMPVVGRPGEQAALSLPGAYEDYLSVAGPTWRNEIDAAVGLELGSIRVGRVAGRVRCPVLVQIADFDRSAPPQAAAKVAELARAEVRHYDGDHFDLLPGKRWFDAGLAHQLHFLHRHLTR